MKEPIKVEAISFERLKTLFDKRVFAIPEIQRDFVWTKKKIIDFLDSISKQYPIGSFLICKVPAKMTRHVRESTVLPRFGLHNRECYIVVDGQQRLSVLYSILNEMKIKKTRHYRDGIDFSNICLSSRQDAESDFGFYKTAEDSNIKLSDILSGKIRDTNKSKRVKGCKKAFEKYEFPFIFLSKYDEPRMREAFIRLNKGGTSLSSEDKIFALSYHKDTDIRRHCDHLLHDLKKGFDTFERIHFIKSIAADLGIKDFVGTTSLNTFAKNIRKRKYKKYKLHEEYKKKHRKIFRSIELAADFLARKAKHASYLPYPAMLSILSIFYYHNNNYQPKPEQIKQIDRWFWITGFTKRYSGSNQRANQLNDGEEMKKLATEKKYRIDLEGKTRIEPISMRELAKIRYNKAGAVRNAFFCHLISKKPLNFTNGQPIPIEEDVSSLFNTKNNHHIFPRDLLKENHFYRDEINRLINICFLTFGENIKIWKKPPWVYLKEYKHNNNFGNIMRSHAIPHKDCVLKNGDVEEKYNQFIKERKLIIKKDLIKLLGKKYVVD